MLELLFSALICVVEYSIFIMFLQHYLNDRWERSRKLFCFKFLGLLICSVTLTFINTFQNSLWNVLTVFTLIFILDFSSYHRQTNNHKPFRRLPMCIFYLILHASGKLLYGQYRT